LLDRLSRPAAGDRRGRQRRQLDRSGAPDEELLMRYILLDRVTELEPGRRARGKKAITLTDDVLHDHFPDFPIYPGALLVEAAAQLAGFLLEKSRNQPGEPEARALLVQIDRTKFYRPARPG